MTILARYWFVLPILAALALFWRVDDLRATYKSQRDDRDRTIAQMAVMTAATDRKYRASEARHASDTTRIEKDKADEISSLRADRDAALAELRNRPRRPAPSATQSEADAEDGPGATGRQLYGEDAEFLVREAARADEIRAEVKACYAQYDSLVAALEPSLSGGD